MAKAVRTQGSRPVIVVGGGIGGTATALALSRRGRRVIVLEQADELTEVGAGIQMPPNAFKAFAALGVLDAVQRIAAYPERLVLGDMPSGRAVYQTAIDNAFVSRFGFRYALMHRGDLLQILVDAARASDLITIETRARVVSFADQGDRVAVATEDGRTFEGRAMIAADGLWSRTRAVLFGDAPPRSDGYVVCRGVVPVDRVPPSLYSQTVTMWGGPELDLFHYPLRRGEIYNIGASYRDESLTPGSEPPQVTQDVLAQRFAGRRRRSENCCPTSTWRDPGCSTIARRCHTGVRGVSRCSAMRPIPPRSTFRRARAWRSRMPWSSRTAWTPHPTW